MRHFLILRKKWSSLQKEVVLAEEIVEASDFTIHDGCLVLYRVQALTPENRYPENENILTAPMGTWMQCEEVQVPTDDEMPSSLLVGN